MSDPIQNAFDRMFKIIKKEHPNFSYFQHEAVLNAYLSSQMSKFRHRKNNPDDYTGIYYDPEGKLRVEDEDPIDEKDIVFFSSRIPNC